MKTCSKCKTSKEIEGFSPDKRAKDGRLGQCKSCRAEAERVRHATDPSKRSDYMKVWYKNHPDYARNKALKRHYGISLAEHNEMLQRQENCCAICSRSEPGGYGTWHVDHDHKTGEIRGLLCHHCNVGLGNFADDVDRLMSAAAYLLQSEDLLARNVGNRVIASRMDITSRRDSK